MYIEQGGEATNPAKTAEKKTFSEVISFAEFTSARISADKDG